MDVSYTDTNYTFKVHTFGGEGITIKIKRGTPVILSIKINLKIKYINLTLEEEWHTEKRVERVDAKKGERKCNWT